MRFMTERIRRRILIGIAGVAIAVWGAAPPGEGERVMKLRSPAFEHNGPMLRRHTGEGADVSPPLAWEGAPEKTKSFVLICDDPDALRVAGRIWNHWMIWNIPAAVRALPEGVEKTEMPASVPGAHQGMNSWPRLGYYGPMPPPGSGPHHYHFRLYALDALLDLPPRAGRADLEKAMKGRVLAETETIGVYERR